MASGHENMASACYTKEGAAAAKKDGFDTLVAKLERAGFTVTLAPRSKVARVTRTSARGAEAQGTGQGQGQSQGQGDGQGQGQGDGHDDTEDFCNGARPQFGLKFFVRFLQSLTESEIAAWTGPPRLYFAAQDLRGNLAMLHKVFYNSEEDMRAALVRDEEPDAECQQRIQQLCEEEERAGTKVEEEPDAECLQLVRQLCEFPYEAAYFLPHIEYPLLDHADTGDCERCGEPGFSCKLCGSYWCEDDVLHRNHYTNCSRGYDHIRRTRTAYGSNTL